MGGGKDAILERRREMGTRAMGAHGRFTLLCAVVTAWAGARAREVEGAGNLVSGACVETYDAELDYFPEKVTADKASTFTVSYHKSYKVVTNVGAEEAYVLYQCGTPAPDAERLAADGALGSVEVTTTVAVPATQADVQSTSGLTFVDLIGERSHVVATGESDYVSSPCYQQAINEGSITAYGFGESSPSGVDVKFGYSGAEGNNAVGLTEYNEKSALGMAEWVEFVALFFNREGRATGVLDSIQGRIQCAAARAAEALAAAGGVRPKVLWAEALSYAGTVTWQLGACPEWYCDLVTLAGGEFVEVDSAVSHSNTNFSALAEIGADADVWIYPSNNWDSDPFDSGWTMDGDTDALAALASVPAVAHKRVFDVRGSEGSSSKASDYYERRVAEPDVLLEDLVKAIWGNAADFDHDSVWLRNVLEGKATTIWTADDCTADAFQADSYVYFHDGCSGDCACAADGNSARAFRAPSLFTSALLLANCAIVRG